MTDRTEPPDQATSAATGTPGAPGELLTVAEAAARLGVSLPRLRRLLARPENAACLTSVTRETRTGTRTATAIPFSFLSELKALCEREKAPQRPQEREREQIHTDRPESFPFPSEGALVRRVMDEQAARIEDLRGQVASLQAQLDAANERQAALLNALAREQAMRALPPAPQDRHEGQNMTAATDQAARDGARPNLSHGFALRANTPRRWWWPFTQRKTG